MIALCLGSAARGGGDMLQALRALEGRVGPVVACNDAAALHAGPLAALVSHHPDLIPKWLALRAEAGLSPPAHVVIPNEHPACPGTTVLPIRWDGGSGLYTAQVALDLLGARGAILCGVPLDPEEPHVVRDGPWPEASTFRSGFRAALDSDGGRIRSMSGWTKCVLGVPTPEWVDALTIRPEENF